MSTFEQVLQLTRCKECRREV